MYYTYIIRCVCSYVVSVGSWHNFIAHVRQFAFHTKHVAFHHLLLFQPHLEQTSSAGGVGFHLTAATCLLSAKQILRNLRWSVTCVTSMCFPLTQQHTSHRLGAATWVRALVHFWRRRKCRTQTAHCSVQKT